MKLIRDLKEGDRVAGIYLCKTKNPAVTKNGKPYENLILQDKTGQIDAKIWEPHSEGIGEFAPLDFVDIFGDVTSFNGALQISVKRARLCREGEYDPADYVPVSSRDNDEMYKELTELVKSVKNRHLHAVLRAVFVEDEAFAGRFRKSSAAKSVHHGFVGGLMEHTVSVAKLCDHLARTYPVLNRDLLVTAALTHDIGKVTELSAFPENDYTDEGQFLGHIYIGAQQVEACIAKLPDFPVLLKNELIHCILAHHGKLEFGSPKKPAIPEAIALNLADELDAKMETFKELFASSQTPGWQGYNRLFESYIFETQVEN
ncbi:MAG: HD domain-containing protein [Lachnospiraceae bacterium]|nr:HD domain-containing protein [Lachnospiraceae bacterium]